MRLAIRCFVLIARMQVAALADAHKTGKLGALLRADRNSASSILFQTLYEIGINAGRVARLKKGGPTEIFSFRIRSANIG